MKPEEHKPSFISPEPKRTDSWDLLIDKIITIREQALNKTEPPPPFPSKEKVVSEKRIVAVADERPLAEAEMQLAKSVFGSSLSYEKIFITNRLNKNNEPSYSNVKDEKFLLNLGPEYFYYTTLNTEVGRGTFIHMLMHVWQLVHSDTDSSNPPACYESDTSDYPVGIRWNQYSAEQQAMLVEDWFNDGMLETDSRFNYIRDHVRKGVN